MNLQPRHDAAFQRPEPPADGSPRWCKDGAQLVEASRDSDVWIDCGGTAEPLLWRSPLTLDQVFAMRVTRWAYRLAIDTLSKRELQVFMQLAVGQQVGEIAKTIYLSVKSVSEYRSRILEKTRLQNNVEIAIYAYRYGLIDWGRLPATDERISPPPVFKQRLGITLVNG